jgi:hypothetical protein
MDGDARFRRASDAMQSGGTANAMFVGLFAHSFDKPARAMTRLQSLKSQA